jgi:basic amino acid/polyamine antiporter, APA family
MNWRVKSLDDILATAERRALTRSLGGIQLMLLGVGAIIGTGIFVLTAEAAQKAGPGMMLSFVIAGFVCAVTALCYAELASMVPVSGSAYTYSYAVLGELVAWIVGWALILEYAVAASAVSVGWSNYFVGVLHRLLHIDLPVELTKGPFAGGVVNLPAMVIALVCTSLLVIGTRESARVNAVLVTIKIAALAIFALLAVPAIRAENFTPFMPLGFDGVAGAASSIFFAYVGFDAVSTAAEETRDPQRNVPFGLIGSLVLCTGFYLLVASGAIGTIGAQPVFGPNHEVLSPGSVEWASACKAATAPLLSCSDEPLAFVLQQIGYNRIAGLIGLAAFLALPSVILMMLFGQTRLFFAMARDGLLPSFLNKLHPTYHTPHVVTIITGVGVTIFSGFFPVGLLADVSNSGTLCAFFMVSIGVMILRLNDPSRRRSFRVPLVWVVGPLAVIGCGYLFYHLPTKTNVFFIGWTAVGLLAYALYGYRHSDMARGGKKGAI